MSRGGPGVRIVSVREASVPVAAPMRNAYIDFSRMTCSIVAIEAAARGRRFVGYGYTSNGRYAQSGLIRERFIPRLLAADGASLADESGETIDPRRLRDVLMQDEKPGGHGERSVAVGALDMAAWDLASKMVDEPAYIYIARSFGLSAPEPLVPVYAAGGYYEPGVDASDAGPDIRTFVDLGYPVVKLKIGGAPMDLDLQRVESAIRLAEPHATVAVDANGGLDVESAVEYGTALERIGVEWFEEPVEPLDFGGLSEVARRTSTPLATGENLFSTWDVRNLLRFGGLDALTSMLQMDPVLSYGLTEYHEMLSAASELGWDARRFVPHGGNHLNFAAVAAFGLGACEVYPTKFQPFGVVDGSTVVEDGRLPSFSGSGLGLEARSDLAKVLEAIRP